MKILTVLSLVVVVAIAEPPVDNRYLPPQQGSSGSFPPSQNYGPPGDRNEPLRQTDAVFRSRPSSSYGAPNRNSRPTAQYLPPSSQPSSQYGPPARPLANSAPGLGSQNRQGARPLSTQYGAPALSAPSQQYGAPGLNAPSQQYGAPGVGAGGRGQFPGATNDIGGAQSRSYLPPGQGRGYAGDSDDGSNGEPANYNFEYTVKDEQSGNDFGHRESRQGDRAEGLYYVVLPDGRKQTVEYEADENGYRPKVSYEDVGIADGYSGRGQGSQNGGYQNEGPY